MAPHLRTGLATAAAMAALALPAAGCGDEDTEPDASEAPATVQSAPADTTKTEPPGDVTTGVERGTAEQAAEDVLARAEGVDEDVADSVREAARRFDAELERSGGTEEGIARARGGIDRAVQDADPRYGEHLRELLGEIDDKLTTQENAG